MKIKRLTLPKNQRDEQSSLTLNQKDGKHSTVLLAEV
jgi:hypothetical protein